MKKHILLFVLVLLFGFLFFFRLDWNTLVSWDEGWYAVIARTILQRGDWMNMMWKGQPYFDHPPLGFWSMAVTYKLLGISEFTTRLPSAIYGILAIVFIYLTAIELFGKKVIGFVAALIMGTSVWYLIRVRSGDLDSIFVFFYILTVYLSIKSGRNFRWFPLTMAAFAGVILAKTLVGWSAGVLVLFWNWQWFIKSKKNILLTILGIAVLLAIVLPWYYINDKNNIYFIQQHFINVGIRKRTSIMDYLKLKYQLPLFYLHMGVRKWYYLWLAGIALLVVTLKILKKPVLFLFLWNFVILYPFLTTNKTQIWHLIPVYLPMSFIAAAGFYYGAEFCVTLIKKIKPLHWLKPLTKPLIINICFVSIFVVVASLQIKTFYKEVYPTSRYTPDDVAISKAVAKYHQSIYLDDDFTPIALFYSDKNIVPLIDLPDEKRTLLKFFQSDEKNFVVITRNWAVNNLIVAKIPYKILEKNNSFSIVTRP